MFGFFGKKKEANGEGRAVGTMNGKMKKTRFESTPMTIDDSSTLSFSHPRNSLIMDEDSSKATPSQSVSYQNTTSTTSEPASLETFDDGEDDEKNEIFEEDRPVSNEYVLNVAFFSFLGFMAVQALFAIIANSESMLADSLAMSVDAGTYLLNLFAERVKHKPYTEEERQMPRWLRRRRRRLLRLYLELFPPLVSVTTLVVVTIFVIKDSVASLRNPIPEQADEDTPDIWIMLFFSALNLLLDIVNVSCFARADQAFGLNGVIHGSGSHTHRAGLHHPGHSLARETSPLVLTQQTSRGNDAIEVIEPQATTISDKPPQDDDHGGINLNMCSAWTHVCADTMRSITVLVAAGIAAIWPVVTPEVADATGAIIVSIIIIVSLFPLLHGLFLTAVEIVGIWRGQEVPDSSLSKPSSNGTVDV